MTPRPLHELGELQREILELLWQRGEASVRELLEGLQRERAPAYTTVLSVLQKLEKAGCFEEKLYQKLLVYEFSNFEKTG